MLLAELDTKAEFEDTGLHVTRSCFRLRKFRFHKNLERIRPFENPYLTLPTTLTIS
jgi:hypothetical protein